MPPRISKSKKSAKSLVKHRTQKLKPVWSFGTISGLIFVAIIGIFYYYQPAGGEPAAVPADITAAVTPASLEEILKVPDVQNRLRVKETPLGYLNVRAGPGTEYKLLRKAHIGDVFDYTTFEVGWYRVIDEGGEAGWVAEKYVELLD